MTNTKPKKKDEIIKNIVWKELKTLEVKDSMYFRINNKKKQFKLTRVN